MQRINLTVRSTVLLIVRFKYIFTYPLGFVILDVTSVEDVVVINMIEAIVVFIFALGAFDALIVVVVALYFY